MMAKHIEIKEARNHYTAEIDPRGLEQQPIFLEQHGALVGVIIPASEYLAFRAWKDHSATTDDFSPAWYANRIAFEKMLPELLTTHYGKWVAVYNQQLIDSDEKPGELIWRMDQKLGNEPVYFDQVLEKPHVYRIPSVWVKRT